MSRRDQYIESDNAYHEPIRDNSHGNMMLMVIMTLLFMVLTAVLAVVFFHQKKANEENVSVADVSSGSNYILIATMTPTPVPEMTANQNPILYPASAVINIPPEFDIDPGASPSSRGLTQNVLISSSIASSYSREFPISFPDPLSYGSVPGVLTYRGNNFRSSAAYGYTNLTQGTLTQVWEYADLGTRLSSTMTFEWSGVAWTGQPLIVQWSDEVRRSMNLYPEKANKDGLVEVIVASLDGYVYFFDIEDGSQTRDRLYVGASIKGTPAVDPRGYPLLYLGQGDDNADDGKFGLYIYSLIDGRRLYFYDGVADSPYRVNWSAFDSSPLIDAATDTLIWPAENGIVYTIALNTSYTQGGESVGVSPVVTGYKYIFNDTQGAYLGIESSIAVYGNLGYFIDNNAELICIDLNAMEMLWVVKLGDDSDITPVIDEETDENGNRIPCVYVGTEVDNQGGQGEYSGAAYVYKINGLTGAIIWQNSVPCYTYNGETSDTDQTGGCLGNPIIGKKNISDLVIFPFSMTNGLMSGNRLVAFNKLDGTTNWSYDMNIYSYSSPVDCYDENGNAYIVIGDSLGQIHLVNGLNGERITYIQTSRFIGTENETTSGIIFEASPAVYGNMMIIGTKSGSVFGVNIG